jgi:NAD-dependent deacetylase
LARSNSGYNAWEQQRPVIHLKDYERIVFFTGAGLSAESGIDTYRGPNGVWQKYDFRQYACQSAFDEDPERVWDFHDARRAYVDKCEPNAAHEVIASVQRDGKAGGVITQNIDGLHQKAGAEKVLELHGSLWRVRCPREGYVEENRDIPIERRCGCGAYLRPDVVWFEDPLKVDVIRRAAEALQQCDLLVSIGTSAVVYPAAELPLLAMERGAATVEINIADTPMSHLYDHVVRMKATDALQAMAA